MEAREVRSFCRAVAEASRSGSLSRQQARTLIGQARGGQLCAAQKGLTKIAKRRERQCDQCQN